MNRTIVKVFLFVSFFSLAVGSLVRLVPTTQGFRDGAIEIVRWRRGVGKTIEKVGPLHGSWVPLERISLHLIHAVLTAEDARFYRHWGFDPREIWVSLNLNLSKGRFVRGASTITQQVVRMGYLSRERSLVRKVREVVGAVSLECVLDKDSILAWYLNMVEFGGGNYGVAEAAKAYFDTEPEFISLPESILLASVLPSPNRWSRELREKKLSVLGKKRFRHILEKMFDSRYITKRQRSVAMATGNFGSSIGSD